MVPEIPVRTAHETDVGPHRYYETARAQAAPRLLQAVAERLLGGEVFEEVARQDDVERLVRERPRRRTVLLEERHIRLQVLPRSGIQVHAVFRAAGDVINEFAVAAAQVQHRVTRADITRKEPFCKELPE